jgi:ribosomal protein L7/L12
VKNREKAYVTKPQRRKAIREITQALELIMAAEKRYVENAPLNLQATQKYEEAEQNVAILEEVLAILEDLF